jgi:hypothetical protein
MTIDKKFYFEFNKAIQMLADAAMISNNKKITDFLIESRTNMKSGLKKIIVSLKEEK